MPNLRSLLSAVIFIAFVVFVEAWFGWRALLSPWRDVALPGVAAAVALTLFTYWLRALRVYDYYRHGMRGRFLVCLRLTLVHNLLNNLLPMRTGELSFPVLMARHFQVPPTHSVPVLLWFRLMDLHTLGLFAWVAAGASLLGPWAALSGAAVWLALLPVAQRLAPRLRDRLGDPQGGRVRALLYRAFDALPDSPRTFWRAWAWTFANWLLKLAVFVWVLGLFLEVPGAAAWLAVIAGDLTSVLPVHGVAGAGTYEAGVVAALLPFGVTADAALAAAVNLHLFLLGSAVFGGLLTFTLPGGRDALQNG
ncbi:lysylphosphatidylglycerol synthase transmembrane domain-containing protein [Thioalkalivibrio thiocyanodenitrificans]|uniref:lysylphosphatidylglycerol synthase transmembrane domain-containing protein n=1 Tax=Thioalkalivibrio thiocyanodenitrificans TaxID=243063 RepID=UPI000378E2AD|nr:lysylphosphatidylglycerol synthase transmembrane domain-containing protein [Thioalkalivibrio thiocyanodenitrificans]